IQGAKLPVLLGAQPLPAVPGAVEQSGGGAQLVTMLGELSRQVLSDLGGGAAGGPGQQGALLRTADQRSETVAGGVVVVSRLRAAVSTGTQRSGSDARLNIDLLVRIAGTLQPGADHQQNDRDGRGQQQQNHQGA